MALWLCRAGKIGEFETKFIEDKKIYCTWNVDWNMSLPPDHNRFKEKLSETYPDVSENTLRNWCGQLWAFSHSIKAGDWVLLPSKIKPVIYVGEVKSDYQFDAKVDDPYKHFHQVSLFREVLRSDFDQDLLYSLGAFMTVCRITRNNAEERIQAIVNGTKQPIIQENSYDGDDAFGRNYLDLEENALAEIAEKIISKYNKHDLAKLVSAILQAKGFTTFISPPGPDGGVDILASQGSLGFDSPHICVQVKSGNKPLERTVHDQLIGAMSNHKAEYGMLVSWGGFKSTITRAEASHFFKVRLWTHKEIVQEFLCHYEDLPEDIREAIPLKRIWIIDKRTD